MLAHFEWIEPVIIDRSYVVNDLLILINLGQTIKGWNDYISLFSCLTINRLCLPLVLNN